MPPSPSKIVKESPILMSAPMVPALLNGTKTQTRRIVKPQPTWKEAEPGSISSSGWTYANKNNSLVLSKFPDSVVFANALTQYCPYGSVGARLWVRETWATSHKFDHLPPREIPKDANIHYRATWDGPSGLMWRPSIFLMRWMTRITLEITEVRVGRLQSISEEDAKAEGCVAEAEVPYDWWEGYDTACRDRYGNMSHQMQPKEHFPNPPPKWQEVRTHKGSKGFNISARQKYETLWESINGYGSWNSNCWVWVLSFRVLQNKH